MKKFITMALAMMMALLMVAASFTACKKNENNDKPGEISSALSLLEKVWGAYGDEEKFSVIGGDSSAPGEMKEDAPGKFPLNADALKRVFVIPEAYVTKIEDAASISHMMNANTFTAGAFRVASGTDMKSFASELKVALQNNQWMCGFPDKLAILSVEDYIVCAYGAEDLIDVFSAKVRTCYQDAKLLEEGAAS